MKSSLFMIEGFVIRSMSDRRESLYWRFSAMKLDQFFSSLRSFRLDGGYKLTQCHNQGLPSSE